MTTIACMGGFCHRRDKCRLHDQPSARFIVERLCEPGEHDCFEPLRVIRPAGTWERGASQLLAPASWADPIH